MYQTLREARNGMGLSSHELYDGTMQERVLREHLIPPAGEGALHRFLTKNIGSAEDAQFAAARQWASIGVPVGMKNKYGVVSDGNVSYHQKKGQNAAEPHATKALRDLLSRMQGTK